MGEGPRLDPRASSLPGSLTLRWAPGAGLALLAARGTKTPLDQPAPETQSGPRGWPHGQLGPHTPALGHLRETRPLARTDCAPLSPTFPFSLTASLWNILRGQLRSTAQPLCSAFSPRGAGPAAVTRSVLALLTCTCRRGKWGPRGRNFPRHRAVRAGV